MGCAKILISNHVIIRHYKALLIRIRGSGEAGPIYNTLEMQQTKKAQTRTDPRIMGLFFHITLKIRLHETFNGS